MASPKTSMLGEIWDYLKTGWKYFRTKKAEPVLKDVLLFFKKKTVKISFWILILLSLIPIILFIWAVITAFNSYDGFLVKQRFIWSFLSMVIPFTFVGLILGAILKTVSVATSIFSKLEGVVDLYYNPEHAEKLFHRFFLVLWWLMVAALFCYLVPVHNSPVLFTLILIITVFLIISTLAGVITPDPEFNKKIWKMVVLMLVVATILLFLGPSGYKKAARSKEKSKATVEKIHDNRLANKIDSLRERMEQSEKNNLFVLADKQADSLAILCAKVDSNRTAKITFKKTKSTVASIFQKDRGRNDNTKSDPSDQSVPIVSQYSSAGHLWEIDPALKPDNMTWISPTEFELELQPGDSCNTYVKIPDGGKWMVVNPTGKKYAIKDGFDWAVRYQSLLNCSFEKGGWLIFRGGEEPNKIKVKLGV